MKILIVGILSIVLSAQTIIPVANRVQACKVEQVPILVSATQKGPNQINLTWQAVSDPGYGYLVEIKSLTDPRYSEWTELKPVPSATGYTCDETIGFNGGTCKISDPSGVHVYNPPNNGIPYWVTEKTYIDPLDDSPAQFIAAGLRPNTAYSFRVRTYTPSSYGVYSNAVIGTTADYPARYVSLQGNDTHDGTTVDTAWRSIAYGSGSITCGQVLIVMGGSYAADGVFLSQMCNAQQKAVVLVNPGETATITSSKGLGAPTIGLYGTFDVVDGIVSVSETPQPSSEYDVVISGDRNALLNAEVHPPVIPFFTHYGVTLTGAHNLIYRSYVHDYGSPDATQNPGGNGGFMFTVYGTSAHHNVVWGNHFTRGGHDCSLCKAGCNNNRWLNNVMDGGWGSGWQVIGTGPSGSNLLEGNIIKGVGQLVTFYKPAIQLSYGYNTVRRNVALNPSSAAVEFSALYTGDTAANDLVYNNTFYSPMSCVFQSHAGGVQSYDNDLFANNICYKLRGGFGDMYVGNTTNVIRHNSILYIDKTGQMQPDAAIVIWNHDAQADFQYPVSVAVADKKYNPPFSNNKGLDVDPQFVNEGLYFNLKLVSPLIGAGIAITDPTWGSTVGKVDLGAFGISKVTTVLSQ